MSDYDRMSPEFALVRVLETVPGLRGRVGTIQPPRGLAAPFAFYVPTSDDERMDLDGRTGLQSWAGTVHLVTGNARGLQLLSIRAIAAMLAMQGIEYETPEDDPEEGPKGRILVEYVEAEQSSPDLYETEVGLYRRIYTVRLDYQTEEIFEEVVSG